MTLEGLLARRRRERAERVQAQAGTPGTPITDPGVPPSGGPKPPDSREKSDVGTPGTRGTPDCERPAREAPPNRAALARDDDQRGGDASAHRARAAALIERCDAAGVRLRLAGDGLRVGRAIAERPDLADELRARRYGVLVELRAREGLCFICGDPAPPVSTMPSGEPVHVDCLDRAVAACKGLEP